MAHKKRMKPMRKKKSKPNNTRDWTGILIGALIDLLIGTLLIIIQQMMD